MAMVFNGLALGLDQASYGSDAGPSMALLIIPAVFGLAIGIFFIAVIWKIFSKAGEPGWAILVPIYSSIVMLKMIGKPWWVLFIPVWNFIVLVFMFPFGLARKFGKGSGFGWGLLLLPYIFYPILGFGSAQYNANA